MTKKTVLRVALYAVLIIAVIVVGLQLSFSFYFNKKIKTDLQKEVVSQSQGEYQLKIENLSTNIFNQSIYLTDFLLEPVNIIDSTSPKYYASASKISLVNFKLFAFLLRKELIISGMELEDPSGNIFRNSATDTSESKESKRKFSIYSLISKHIHSLQIKDIKISNADIMIYDDFGDSIPSINSKENELKISNLRIDKSAEEAGRLFLADTVNLVINKFAYNTSDGLYSIHVKQLSASYSDSTLMLDSCELIPNYSKIEFAGKAGKQTDRLNISAESLNFSSMDVKQFFERNWFIARTLNIDTLFISAFRDKNDHRIPVLSKSVQQLLKGIPFYTIIDSINVNDAEIFYEEIAEGSSAPGKVSFNALDATITGFTSDSTLFSEYNVLQLNATCRFMNKGKLKAQYSFPLNTDKMVFDCSGELVDMPLPEINLILEPGENISIKDGFVESMKFSFHANENASQGEMEMRYHHLKIELLNKKDGEAGLVQDVLSFLAHQFVIKEENPSPGKAVRITKISYPRDPTRFIFNYSWKSLLSGIKPTIGLPEKSKKR
ncbi:MAG: hypothetical protein FD170_2801 [Bacteroidetes bacterium]|nr:MAG: hypothetical protein FD170_2801 [Bacteroidota bacterium]